jgi:hypothetical protein
MNARKNEVPRNRLGEKDHYSALVLAQAESNKRQENEERFLKH